MPDYMTKFRRFDAANRSQVVTIEWEMLTQPDDCRDKPDERQDGFWPSRDPKAAGYVDPAQFDHEQAKAEARMKAWHDDVWYYLGVIARAHIMVPSGQGSFVTYTLDSPGIWGIESDSTDYIKETFEEEKVELLSHIATMGEYAKAQSK